MEAINVDAPGARAIFWKWLKRGDSIGVFQNMALDSASCGHRIFLPITPDEAASYKVGQTRAPDGSYGMGWRYLLQSIECSMAGFTFEAEAA